MTEFTDRLIEICGKAHVLTGDAIEPRYRRDWLGLCESHPLYVVRPDSTRAVAAIMKACAATKTPIIPLGGNSGLTGATIAGEAEGILLMSLERMNNVRTIDTDGQVMIAEAGCVIENLHKAADQAGLMFPLVFGAK